jgi:flavin-dependent dehydrogenase
MAARELARGGAKVLLVERQRFPRWKVCGACLSPGTQAVLADVGLGHLADSLGAVPLRTLRLAGWSLRAEVPLRGSAALSRAALDQALVDAAVEVGVTFLSSTRARPSSIEPEARCVTLERGGGPIIARARVVIAADGLGGGFLADAHGGGEATVPPGGRIGFGATYGRNVPGYEAGAIHMGVGDAGYVGLVRLEDGTLDVASAISAELLGGGVRPEDVVGEILARAGMAPLPAHAPAAGWKGTPVLTRTLSTRGANRLLAVGDAAGYVEPFTGEGIAWALSGARALAPIALRGIRSWDPRLVDDWDRAYLDTVGKAAALCRGVAWGLRWPALSRAGLRVLSLAPSVANPFVRRASRAPTTQSQAYP